MPPLTCGEGLADRAALLERLADVVAALADNLELHRTTLDRSDAGAITEDAAYADLSARGRVAADAVRRVADGLARQRTLPAARHLDAALADPRLREAFERFVGAERELATVVAAMLRADEGMLTQGRGSGAGPSSGPTGPDLPREVS